MKIRMIICSAAALVMALAVGCERSREAGNFGAPKQQFLSAPREELLKIITRNMKQVRSLSATVTATLIEQGVIVPASIIDDVAKRRGKEYRKSFSRTTIDGSFLMSRPLVGKRQMKFYATVPRMPGALQFVSRGDEFWVVQPAPKGAEKPLSVTHGFTRSDGFRRADYFSLRPQDIMDLYLYDDALSPRHGVKLVYIETWGPYYVVNVLRQNRKEMIHSKIWIERANLTVTLHQIFDTFGAILAEARFANYLHVALPRGKRRVWMPQRALFMWPRDRVAFDVKFGDIRVNRDIAPHKFEFRAPANALQREMPRDAPASRDR